AIQPSTPELAKSFALTETKGALVASVTDGSPAARAGLKPGDVILRYDGKAVEGPRMLPALVANTEIGRTVELSVIRDGSVRPMKITVGNLSDSRQASATEPARSGRVAERLGVELQQADKGVVVTDVRPDSPADQAGIAEGDVIREVNRTPVERIEDVQKAMDRSAGAEKQVLLRVEREGAQRYVVIEMS